MCHIMLLSPFKSEANRLKHMRVIAMFVKCAKRKRRMGKKIKKKVRN